MAERWLQCAETFKIQSSAVHPAKRHRRPATDTRSHAHLG
jgi:hypothetical protein